MPKDYHKNIIRVIEELASKKQFLKIDPNNRQLKIEHPYKESGFFYKPDRFFINAKNNKYFIIEILDTQKKDKTIADICRIIFFKKCYKALFIVKKEKQRGNIEMIVDTIKVIFHDMIFELIGKRIAKRLNKNKIIKFECQVITEDMDLKVIKKELKKYFS